MHLFILYAFYFIHYVWIERYLFSFDVCFISLQSLTDLVIKTIQLFKLRDPLMQPVMHDILSLKNIISIKVHFCCKFFLENITWLQIMTNCSRIMLMLGFVFWLKENIIEALLFLIIKIDCQVSSISLSLMEGSVKRVSKYSVWSYYIYLVVCLFLLLIGRNAQK